MKGRVRFRNNAASCQAISFQRSKFFPGLLHTIQQVYAIIITFLCILICTCTVKAQTFLHANGSKIVDAGDHEVLLHGMNLGGWLEMEGYMLQVDGNYGQWQIRRDMHINGATEEEVDRFFSDWRKKHTTAADIRYLKSLDLNCIRLPMHYELFLTLSQRAVRNKVMYNQLPIDTYIDSLVKWYDGDMLFTDKNTDGFSVLDSTLQWAGSNGMWVIPDLHDAPGGQGAQISTCDALVQQDLWNRTDLKGRKIYALITQRLWKAISGRYKTDARIAMYDLLNEPNGAVHNNTVKVLYDSLIASIRGNGDQHLILLEGNGFGNEYTGITPDLFAAQQNLVWSSHRYWAPNDPNYTDGNANELHLIANLVKFRAAWNVPVWVGETGENSNEWISKACKNLNNLNIGWCLWTQKRLGRSAAPFYQTSSPMIIPHASIYTPEGRKSLLDNVLFENCVRQKDYEYAMTKGINSETTTPYNGIASPIPGKIYASDYDMGNNGIAYADSIAEMDVYNGPYWNSGEMYRNDGVDIEQSSDISGNGLDIGWIEKHDWMNYTVKVNRTGNYSVQLRVANGETYTGSLAIKADGKVVDTVSIPVTGGNQQWRTVTMGKNFRLPAGSHVIQVFAVKAGGHLGWINFLPAKGAAITLQIVPNPANSRFQIYNIEKDAFVTISEVSGKQLMNFTVPGENYLLNISALKTGAYIVKITEGTKVESRMIIKK